MVVPRYDFPAFAVDEFFAGSFFFKFIFKKCLVFLKPVKAELDDTTSSLV